MPGGVGAQSAPIAGVVDIARHRRDRKTQGLGRIGGQLGTRLGAEIDMNEAEIDLI
jgi:hypothetical protein